MCRDLNAHSLQISLYQRLKLFIADVRLPKTSQKAFHSLGPAAVKHRSLKLLYSV